LTLPEVAHFETVLQGLAGVVSGKILLWACRLFCAAYLGYQSLQHPNRRLFFIIRTPLDLGPDKHCVYKLISIRYRLS
jgi:hypothetical protein